MELMSRIAKQDGEIVQAARGFEQCGVTVISNSPVIVLPEEQGLFVCRKTRAIRKRFANPFAFLFGAHVRRLTQIDFLFGCVWSPYTFPIPSSKLFVEHGRRAIEHLRGAELFCGLRSVRPHLFPPAISDVGTFRGEIQDRWPR